MKIGTEIYLDYNATTPCDPRVVEKMLPFFSITYGNPANGLHRQGRAAGRAVDEAREQVAHLIGATPNKILFTAGATESNNLAIFGLARLAQDGTRKRIVTSPVEHKSVLAPCQKLQELGFDLVTLPVDSGGRVIMEAAREVITEDTLLVSVQAANNEIGTLQPIKELSALAHENGALFHCDGAQAAGKVPVDVHKFDIDLFSLSAHKLYGPKGIGALYVKGGTRTIPIEPLVYGGGQEKGLRSGTLNVPGIAGFGEACRVAAETHPQEAERIAVLRDHLEMKLQDTIPGIQINGHMECRLPNTSSLSFPGIDADALLLNLESVMVGTGSACSSGAIEPSHVLQAIGLSRELAFSTVRVSLGRFTEEREILQAEEELLKVWSKLLT